MGGRTGAAPERAALTNDLCGRMLVVKDTRCNEAVVRIS